MCIQSPIGYTCSAPSRGAQKASRGRVSLLWCNALLLYFLSFVVFGLCENEQVKQQLLRHGEHVQWKHSGWSLLSWMRRALYRTDQYWDISSWSLLDHWLIPIIQQLSILNLHHHHGAKSQCFCTLEGHYGKEMGGFMKGACDGHFKCLRLREVLLYCTLLRHM